MPPLIRRSDNDDDAGDTVMVEDVLYDVKVVLDDDAVTLKVPVQQYGRG